MQLIPRLRTRFLASEHGFSMIVVMGVMAASSLFVAAAFAAANGDLPLTRDSQDRKQAYAAAEAGINLYQYHLNQDPDYWTKCTNVPAPNGTENQPVNQAWSGTGTDPRRWRNVAGMPTQYTLELLPANGATSCVEGNLTSMVDSTTGAFRIRATGRPRSGSKLKRSIVASFRRHSFLDFLYFTDFETTDPINYASAWQSWATLNCGSGKYRGGRAKTGGPNGTGCSEIQFADLDAIKGPMHTNDSILTCGTPQFGRTTADAIEFSQPDPVFTQLGGSGCTGSPDWRGTRRSGVTPLTMPSTNASLQTLASTGGVLYTGTTQIRFNGTNMLVKNPNIASGAEQTVAYPANGVIYVKTGTGGCGSSDPPYSADYDEPSSCGNAYISGTYASSLTIASANDIIVAPPNVSSWRPGSLPNPVTPANGDIIGSGTAVLGLIAQNFVRVFHRVPGDCDTNTNTTPVMSTVRIDAAMLSLKHSFVADNHGCGPKLGNLTVNGAIAQSYRGPVGTGGTTGTGFTKDYNYDDRLRYRSPPFFLEPIAASWHVIRSNEQVPPR
jgi:hypothetical protein